MEYNKPTMWDGKSALKGTWEFTYKVDGIRVLLNAAGEVVSRNGKPLYNMDHLKEKIKECMPEGCEVFLGTFKATVEAVRTRKTYKPVPPSALFSLHPIDPRLNVGYFTDPSKGAIWQEYKKATKAGFEGLVIRQLDVWLKVKKYETVDTTIIGFYEGKGKYTGKLGGFITKHGRVGTGISDAERDEWWRYKTAAKKGAYGEWEKSPRGHKLYDTTIECKCMELTPAGKMRKPRFVRLRPDK